MREKRGLAPVRLWVGAGLVVVGLAVALGFAFVPPHVLIPELIDDPRPMGFVEGLVGFWIAGMGVLLAASAFRLRGKGGE